MYWTIILQVYVSERTRRRGCAFFLLRKIKAVCRSGVCFLHEGEEQGITLMAHPECFVCKMQHARCVAQHMAMIIAIKKAKLFTQQVFNFMALKTASSRGKTSGVHRFQIEILAAAALFSLCRVNLNFIFLR
jgi:hypothetical protein